MKDLYALPLQIYFFRGVPGFRLWDKMWDGGVFTGAQYAPGAPVTLDKCYRQSKDALLTYISMNFQPVWNPVFPQ